MGAPLVLNRRFEAGPYRRNLRAIEQWSVDVIATLAGTKIEPLLLNHSWPASLPQADVDYGPYRGNLRKVQDFLDMVCNEQSISSLRLYWPFDEEHYVRNVGLLRSFADSV